MKTNNTEIKRLKSNNEKLLRALKLAHAALTRLPDEDASDIDAIPAIIYAAKIITNCKRVRVRTTTDND